MTKLKLIAFFALLFLGVSFSNVTAQQVFKTTSQSTIGYLEYVPDDYNSNSNKFPVVIFLHGIGERCPNTSDPNVLDDYIQLVAKLGPPKWVKLGTKFPFILISPQLKSCYGTWPSSYVMEVINHVKTYLRIDERRIYLTGLSLGGGGAWVAAQDYPKVFAALAPVCGGYNSPSKACGIASEDLPTWGFHGDKDGVVSMSKTINMINAINNCTPKPSPLAKVTIYPGVAHNAWDNAYKPDHTVHNPNVYEWMMSYTNVHNGDNKIPVANAGSDIVASSNSASLRGSGTDTDGSIASYTWTKMSGPAATLGSTSSATLNVSNMASGSYVFRLQVKDNSGNTDSDYVKVTVGSSAPLTSVAPVASAGSDKLIKLPTSSTSLVGKGTDSDGTIKSYKWTKVSGSSVSMSGTTSATLNLSGMVSSVYTFRLTVTDNTGKTDYDDVKVTVTYPPVAKAGSDRTITLPTNSLVLSGSGTDSDGTIVKYQWSKYSGPSAVLTNASTKSLTLSGLIAGTYVFKLKVTDNNGATAVDYVTVTVKSSSV